MSNKLPIIGPVTSLLVLPVKMPQAQGIGTTLRIPCNFLASCKFLSIDTFSIFKLYFLLTASLISSAIAFVTVNLPLSSLALSIAKAFGIV